jgi:hypothetical protein
MPNRISPLLLLAFFLLFLFFQISIADSFSLFNIAFCFVYAGFLILLPIETPTLGVLLWGMILGLLAGLSTQSMGIHAAACVAMAFSRSYMLRLLSPSSGYEGTMRPSPASMGFSWFLRFSLPLLFIHHILLFVLENSGFSQVTYLFSRITSSVLLSFTVLLLLMYLVEGRVRER